MSENFLRLIPTDPHYVPHPDAQYKARNLFISLLEGSEVQVVVTEEVSFIDPGTNLERIQCHSCAALLPLDWWIRAMDRAHADTRFGDLAVIVPCCETHSSLNDLYYEWPAGFARFLLETHSSDRDLTAEQLSLFEPLLGCHVRKIWARY